MNKVDEEEEEAKDNKIKINKVYSTLRVCVCVCMCI